jgi:transcriptional regulator with XRE-family HTH domain
MYIAQAIKKARKEKGIRQNKLAEMSGITQAYLSGLENGKKIPSIEVLETISKALKVPFPFMLWLSLTEKDFDSNKVELFRMVKPFMDEIIKSIL